MPRPRELSELVTRRPEAVAPERSEGATKGLRVTNPLSSRRSRRLTYLDYMNKNHTTIPLNAFLSVEKLLIDFPSEEPSRFPWQLALRYHFYDDVEALTIWTSKEGENDYKEQNKVARATRYLVRIKE